MKGRGLLVRVAAGLALLQGVAHGLLLATYIPHHGPAETQVVSAMQAHFFQLGGIWPHSYWELYTGYAWLAAISCAIEAGVLWIVAKWAARVDIKPLLWLFIGANLVHASMVLRFFFLLPFYADMAVALLLVASIIVQRHKDAADVPMPA